MTPFHRPFKKGPKISIFQSDDDDTSGLASGIESEEEAAAICNGLRSKTLLRVLLNLVMRAAGDGGNVEKLVDVLGDAAALGKPHE